MLIAFVIKECDQAMAVGTAMLAPRLNKAHIWRLIVGNATLPGALLLDKAPAGSPKVWPAAALGQKPKNCLGQSGRMTCLKSTPVSPWWTQAPITAHIRSHYKAPLCHGLKRFEWCHQFSQTHRIPGVRQNIDEIIIALDIGMRHPAGKNTTLSDKPRRSACSLSA